MITIDSAARARISEWHRLDEAALEALASFARETSDVASAVVDRIGRRRVQFAANFATLAYARAAALAQRPGARLEASGAWQEFYRAVRAFVASAAEAIGREASAGDSNAARLQMRLAALLEDDFGISGTPGG